MNGDELQTGAKRNLLSVLDYLLHLDRLRSRPVFRLSDHKLPFFHEHAFQDLPGVQTNLVEGAEEVWLSIRRLQANPPPNPHDWLRPWINIPNDPGKKPTLAESVVLRPSEVPPIERLTQSQHEVKAVALTVDGIGGSTSDSAPADAPPEEITLRLEDVPEIQDLFHRYMSEHWTPWSKTESARRKTIHKYDQFFSLARDVEAGGGTEDGIEIAWGLGIAKWDKDNETQSILYPLISRTVELSVDPQTMSITVRPTERDPAIHVDAFEALNVPQAPAVEKRARAELDASESTLSPFDPATYEGILRFAAANLDGHGVYWPHEREQENDRSLPPSCSHLVITDTWVIYARQRSTNFIAADVQRLRQAVDDADALPPAPALFVTEPSDQAVVRAPRVFRGMSSAGLGAEPAGQGGLVEDLYFAKPFNEVQVSIIDRLEQADGVVVQGPPGTGKTHTIANIICHYLAIGKKVLVSAQHEAPLAVLQDQIPEALRPLTISLLTSEREGLKQLERSVRKIASEVNNLNESELERDIGTESNRIDKLHQKLASLDRELRDWAGKQTAEAPFLGDNTRPERLARYVVDQEQSNSWFPDILDGSDKTLPTFSDEDVAALRSARAEVGVDLIYLEKVIPASDALPIPEDIARLHGDLQQFEALNHEVFEIGNTPPLRMYTLPAFKRLEELQGVAAKAHVVVQAATQYGWQTEARRLLTELDDNPLARHLREWIRAAGALEKDRQQFLADALVVPTAAETDGAVFEAVRRLAQRRRPFGLFGGSNEAKQLVRAIRMGGVEPSSAEQWTRVQHYLHTARVATKLVVQWQQLSAEFGGPALGVEGFAAIKPMADLARPLEHVWTFDSKIADHFVEEAQSLFAKGIDFAQLPYSLPELGRLRTSIDSHLQHSRLKVAAQSRGAIEDVLKRCSGPIVDELQEFVRSALGNINKSVDEIMGHWSDLLTELQRLEGLQIALKTVRDVTTAVETAGAKSWAQALRTEPPTASADKWIPTNWRTAWEWARAKGYLDQIDGREALRRLAQDRTIAEEELQRAYLRVVELRTWRALKKNMTPRVGAALNAYLTAISRIGLGTGIRAVRYRQDARRAMMNAFTATPCWIMGHWRVSESLPPELGMFDLLIIDEASQSDVWALPAIARAKKVLVVGDDKQVSPSDVGIAENDIASLRRRFLSHLPYGENLLPGTSIYDLGSTMFAADVIRLREHFRCVTPIIEFSNRQFYDHEIMPLRVPKPSERLDPPLIDVYVKGGYRADRRKINKPEAAAIIKEIKAITEDPGMAHRTIGVVSLLGADQAKYIQEKLLNELGEDLILQHSIRCGDAMHFQGKEADIVMISMVAAGAIRADSGRTYEQRYNVACSRARDRMYVFRSFDRAELNNSDLRARLLDHLDNPLGMDEPRVNEFRELCESEFEREVYDELVKRGYRVLPQVQAGGYRIDMVVEGGEDRRLAIECDGDQYHGVDRWMADLTRQRVLERMGWRFWRCWASSWIANREGCLTDLLEALGARGVEPCGGGVSVTSERPRLVERRVIEPERFEDPKVPEAFSPAEVAGTPQHDGHPDRVLAPALATAGPGQCRHEGATLGVESAAPADVAEVVNPMDLGKSEKGRIQRRAVDLDDLVTYVNVETPDNLLSVRICDGQSDPRTGLINEHTPLAEALLGAEEGEVVEAHLPMGTVRFRILEIRQPENRVSV
jgi:very-short-patch-repair endonuclease